MKINPVYLSDLFLLRDVFAPSLNSIAVFDPYHRLTGVHERTLHFLDEPLKQSSSGIFFADLGSGITQNKSSVPSFYIGNEQSENQTALYYINNPDGTIRWIFPSGEKSNAYLSLYNTGTFKGKLYKKVTQLARLAGQEKRLVSGVLFLQQNMLETVKQYYEIEKGENISFFTGTRGETRKVVMEIHNEVRTTDFIKIPVTEISKSLIQNETDMLSSLSNYDFTTLSIPKVSKKIKGYSRISNVKPAVTISADRITAIHVSALAELYNLSHENKTIKNTAAWTTISNNMEFMKQEIILSNGLDIVNAKKLIHLLTKLFKSINTDETVSVSVSHGDFTPWNMYCDEQRLFVYDWEMAKNGIPMFFDLFHFSFQSIILQQQKDFITVKKAIENWKATALVQQMVKKFKINTELNFRLYLLFNVSHYMRQYIGEKELLIQSEWMMNAWMDALEEVTNTKGNTTSNA